MTADEQEEEKILFTIGEVASKFGVNTSLIRFWEKEFDIIKPQKNKKGNRLFTRKDVKNFGIIHHLVKEKGYTLQGARQKLKGENGDTERDAEIAEKLKKMKSFLLELKASLGQR